MEDILLHGHTALEVLDNDAIHDLGSDFGVPHAFGIDDHNRSFFTDGKTGTARTFDTERASGQSLRFELVAQGLKELIRGLWRAARPRADEQMTGVMLDFCLS